MKKIGILLMAVIVLTGCVQQTSLTQQESDTIAAYAANITLKYDKNYIKKLVDTDDDAKLADASEELVQEELDNKNKELATKEEEDQQPTTQENMNDLTMEQDESISSILQLDGFEITYEGFLYSQQLEDINAENTYTANSLDDNEFLILKFNIENTTDETKVCDVLSMSPKLRISINGNEPIDSFGSLLSNDLSTLYNEMDAHTSKDVVLLVEVPKEYDKNISSISLTVIAAGKTSTIELN